jgi:hypothetical protein
MNKHSAKPRAKVSSPKTSSKKAPRKKTAGKKTARKAPAVKTGSKSSSHTAVIGGVTIKIARPKTDSKKTRAIRKAVREYYAARRG